MTHALSTTSPIWAILAPITSSGGLSPYVREIKLVQCHVAGTGYRDLGDDVAGRLVPGLSLVLAREPKNPHDERAILIRCEDGQTLGYVPRKKNEVLANLMDAGKALFARLETTRRHGDWLEIRVEVFLRDV